MDFLPATILSGVTYDLLKHGVELTVSSLKNKLTSWMLSETQLEKIVKELQALEVNDEMSEKAIQRKLDESELLRTILEEVQKANNSSIVLQHFGTGDNVAGDKIVKG